MKMFKTQGNRPTFQFLRIAFGLASLHAFTTQYAAAAPVVFGNNVYDFVQVADPFAGANNWVVARDAAAAGSYNGVHGHLATISSQAENDFLFSLAPGGFSEFAGAWLGGTAPQGWLVGPEAGTGFTFTNWGGIEPNNSGYVYMNIGASYGGINPGKWADDSGVQGVPEPGRDPVIGYFVEYENAAAVPEPSSMLLLTGGLFGLGLLMRRRLSKPS